MKLSELSTDRALDVLCEITPYIDNITKDEAVLNIFSEKVDTANMTILSVKIISFSRYNEALSVLLKTHRPDIYGILSAVYQKTADEISAQPVTDTMRQFRDVFQDEDFLDFFKSFAPQGKTAQSAPSANSHGSK